MMRCAFCRNPSNTQCCTTCTNLHWENMHKRQTEAEESYRRDEELGA